MRVYKSFPERSILARIPVGTLDCLLSALKANSYFFCIDYLCASEAESEALLPYVLDFSAFTFNEQDVVATTLLC